MLGLGGKKELGRKWVGAGGSVENVFRLGERTLTEPRSIFGAFAFVLVLDIDDILLYMCEDCKSVPKRAMHSHTLCMSCMTGRRTEFIGISV